MCECFFDVIPITAEIDIRKFQFFGRLCRMESTSLPKQIFLTRLFSYCGNLTNTQMGFIPDVMQLIGQYDLQEYVTDWLSTSEFPAKAAWSSIVRETVKTYYEDERNLRMSRDQDFRHFLSVFCENKK